MPAMSGWHVHGVERAGYLTRCLGRLEELRGEDLLVLVSARFCVIGVAWRWHGVFDVVLVVRDAAARKQGV